MTTLAPAGDVLKVLLVEDNPADARLVAELLKDASDTPIAITHAERLRQALRLLRDGGFNAVLLDLTLPDSDGIETFAAAHAQAPEAPIVVLTGLVDEDVAVRAVRDGAQDYLVKGRVDGAILAKSIRYAIERHQFKETLRASEARYRGLVDGSIQAILIAVDGTMKLANPALARLLGCPSPETAVGLQLQTFLAPEDQQRVADLLADCSRGTRSDAHYECQVITHGGERRSMDCIASPIAWEGAPAVLVTMVDVTQRKRAEEALRLSEEQLRQAQKMEAVGRLAGGIAHDFNNLLTVITGYSEMLLHDVDAHRPPSASDIREIQNAARTAATLTRQLLAFSRRQVLQPKVLSLNDAIRGAEGLLQRLIREDIELEYRLDRSDPRIKVDSGQLEQVLINLAVNARDAMPDGGRLVIETAVVEEPSDPSDVHTRRTYAMVRVTDNGVGMDAETLERVFEPFFTTKEFGKGTGLGLATVYGVVRQCGGEVRVKSALGTGTTFEILFPVVVEALEAPLRAMPAGSSRGHETLLLVEDADPVRAVLRKALEQLGYTVLQAEDGNAALAIARAGQSRFDLLITDAILPGVRGQQLAERIRAVRPGLNVLFMSGYAGDVIAPGGALEPWASFLQKPFSPDDLGRKIREMLDAPRSA